MHSVPCFIARMISSTQIQDGKKDGTGTLTLVRGESYAGQWSQGLKHVRTTKACSLHFQIILFVGLRHLHMQRF